MSSQRMDLLPMELERLGLSRLMLSDGGSLHVQGFAVTGGPIRVLVKFSNEEVEYQNMFAQFSWDPGGYNLAPRSVLGEALG